MMGERKSIRLLLPGRAEQSSPSGAAGSSCVSSGTRAAGCRTGRHGARCPRRAPACFSSSPATHTHTIVGQKTQFQDFLQPHSPNNHLTRLCNKTFCMLDFSFCTLRQPQSTQCCTTDNLNAHGDFYIYFQGSDSVKSGRVMLLSICRAGVDTDCAVKPLGLRFSSSRD